MKLTKDMFDFEKYEFFLSKLSAGDEYLNMVTATWLRAGQFDYDLRITRVPKPPPRYILLNEGEKRLPGDQLLRLPGDQLLLLQGHVKLEWGKPLTKDEYGPVLAGEIWRRKVQE